MILEHLEQYLRDEAEKRAHLPANPFRASSMGRCIREGCFDLIGAPGEPLQPRRMLTLHHGTVIHDNLLTPLIQKAMGWRVVDGKELGDNFIEIDGVKISYHIDLAFEHGEPMSGKSSIGVAEIKGWADRTFEKAMKGEIDHEILVQGWLYHAGTSFNPVLFMGFRKETAHMVEIVFDKDVHEKIVTQTLTGDPVELAKKDPILVTEIRSPFDPSVEQYVHERIKWLKITNDLKQDHTAQYLSNWAKQVPGADQVEDEIEKLQGKDKLATYELINGPVKDLTKAGSWYSFKTGRRILSYPCSYCKFKDICFPGNMLDMKGNRPVFVIG